MPTSKVVAVIFDMYETLVQNSPTQWQETFRAICRTQSLDIPSELLWQEWKSREVSFRCNRVNMMEPDTSPPFQTYFEAWRDAFRDTFFALGLQGNPTVASQRCVRAMGLRCPFEDTLPTLERLKNQFRLGIVSNADEAFLEPVLSACDLPINAVVSSEAARAYKPHPGPFRQMLRMLGVQANQALFVGDNPLDDIYGAQQLGLKTAWISRQGTSWGLDSPPPDHQIDTLHSLLNILEH